MKRQKISGMTLLEVLLSLAILGGTTAVIGEVARSSFQNARYARDLIQAELLAECILLDVRLGILPMEPVVDMPVGMGSIHHAYTIADTHAMPDDISSPALWLYSVSVQNVMIGFEYNTFLMEIAVEVRQNIPLEQRPIVCRLVRWIALDPEEEEDEVEM
jgi:hypothetical protein